MFSSRSQSANLSDAELANLGFLLIEFRADRDQPEPDLCLDPFPVGAFRSLRLRLDGKPVSRVYDGRYFVVPCAPGCHKISAVNVPFFFTRTCKVNVGAGECVRIIMEYIPYPLEPAILLFFLKPHWIMGQTVFSYLHPIWIIDLLIWTLLPRWFPLRNMWLTSHRLWHEDSGPMTNDIAALHLRPSPVCRQERDYLPVAVGQTIVELWRLWRHR